MQRTDKSRMNAAVSLNQNYFYYAYVMLKSLFENNKDSSITVYVLHSELTDEQIMEFQSMAEQYGGQICSVFVKRELFSDQLPTTAEWSIESYFRLAMPDLLPIEVERVLFLDVDIIVNGNIRGFYDTVWQDKLFCVCEEPSANDLDHTFELRRQMFSELFRKGFVYFNVGVMLWNLKEIRKKYNLDFYMKTAQQLNYTFVSPDQDILNYCHWNEVQYADPSLYNQFARIAHNEGKDYAWIKENVAVIHFAGTKPWGADSVHYDIEQLWWDYAKKTPYYAKLCREFTFRMINETYMEDYVKEIFGQMNTLRSNLNDSLALNEKLLGMLNKE